MEPGPGPARPKIAAAGTDSDRARPTMKDDASRAGGPARRVELATRLIAWGSGQIAPEPRG
jgi:hypothetical protein